VAAYRLCVLLRRQPLCTRGVCGVGYQAVCVLSFCCRPLFLVAALSVLLPPSRSCCRPLIRVAALSFVLPPSLSCCYPLFLVAIASLKQSRSRYVKCTKRTCMSKPICMPHPVAACHHIWCPFTHGQVSIHVCLSSVGIGVWTCHVCVCIGVCVV